jgi:hypothetical protein
MRRKEVILGWIALAISTLIAALWAYWGIGEAFHEGWWAPTLAGRLLQTVAYMVPMGICLAIGSLTIRWPKIGAIIFFLFGTIFSLLIFKELWPKFRLEVVLSWLPVTLLVIGVGVLWWFGKLHPLRLAYYIFLGIPLLVILFFGAYPVYKVSTRRTDVSLEAQLVKGNGVSLIWAPAGPGWVRGAKNSANWLEATEICSRLSEDGMQLLDKPQNIRRLPTVEEAVLSMARHGVNCGGTWDAQAQRASYRIQPDKEPPLWDPFTETIYWWTATRDGEESAFIIVYDGNVWSRSKTLGMGSQGFRAVKDAFVVKPAG